MLCEMPSGAAVSQTRVHRYGNIFSFQLYYFTLRITKQDCNSGSRGIVGSEGCTVIIVYLCSGVPML